MIDLITSHFSLSMNRLLLLTARIDEHLREFSAIDTAQEPWSYPSYCGDVDRPKKPNFPALYISRSKDAGLMKMQGSGTAMVNYRVTSRNVDEDREDGVPLYGANIEIQSIEPVKDTETDLSETLFLREFGVARDRDGEGRFAAGNVPSPDDYAIANQASRKKKAAAGVAGAGVLAASALGGTAGGRRLAGSLGKGAVRAASKLFYVR